MRIPARVIVLCCAALPLLVACKSEPIDIVRLEERIKVGYERQVEGSSVESVECPEGLEREPDVTASCRLTLTSGVTGTVDIRVRDDHKIEWTVSRAPGRS